MDHGTAGRGVNRPAGKRNPFETDFEGTLDVFGHGVMWECQMVLRFSLRERDAG